MTNRKQSGREGERFTRLVLVKEVRQTRSHVYYLCRCTCGNETVATYNNLAKGNTRSCGCLRSSIKYAPKTGNFYVNGKVSKSVGLNGYVHMSVRSTHIYAHRLAWKMFYGVDVPKGLDIDHINRIRTDNRISNLRTVTRAENLKNCKPRANALTGREQEVCSLFASGMNCTQIGNLLRIDRHYITEYLKQQGAVLKKGFAATPRARKREEK